MTGWNWILKKSTGFYVKKFYSPFYLIYITGFKVSFDVIFQCRFLIQFQPVGRWPLAETLIWASYWVFEPNVGLFGVWWPCHIDLATSRVNINHPKGEKAQFSPSSAQQWLFLAENDHNWPILKSPYRHAAMLGVQKVGRLRLVTTAPFQPILGHPGGFSLNFRQKHSFQPCSTPLSSPWRFPDTSDSTIYFRRQLFRNCEISLQDRETRNSKEIKAYEKVWKLTAALN